MPPILGLFNATLAERLATVVDAQERVLLERAQSSPLRDRFVHLDGLSQFYLRHFRSGGREGLLWARTAREALARQVAEENLYPDFIVPLPDGNGLLQIDPTVRRPSTLRLADGASRPKILHLPGEDSGHLGFRAYFLIEDLLMGQEVVSDERIARYRGYLDQGTNFKTTVDLHFDRELQRYYINDGHNRARAGYDRGDHYLLCGVTGRSRCPMSPMGIDRLKTIPEEEFARIGKERATAEEMASFAGFESAAAARERVAANLPRTPEPFQVDEAARWVARLLTAPAPDRETLGTFRRLYEAIALRAGELSTILIETPEAFLKTLQDALGETRLRAEAQQAFVNAVRHHRGEPTRSIHLLPAIYQLAASGLFSDCRLELTLMAYSIAQALPSLSLGTWGNPLAAPQSASGRNLPYHTLVARKLLPQLSPQSTQAIIHVLGDGTGAEIGSLFKTLDENGQGAAQVVSSDLIRDLSFVPDGHQTRVLGSKGELIDTREGNGGGRTRHVHLVSPFLFITDWYRSGRLHFAEADMFNEDSLRRAVPGGQAAVATILNVIDIMRFPEEDDRRRALVNVGRSLSEGGFLVAGRRYNTSPRYDGVLSLYRREGNRLVPTTDIPLPDNFSLDLATFSPNGIDLGPEG